MSVPHCIEQQGVHVTVSIGIGVYPKDGTDAETLLKNADTALFYAKSQGRSAHQLYRTDMKVDKPAIRPRTAARKYTDTAETLPSRRSCRRA